MEKAVKYPHIYTKKFSLQPDFLIDTYEMCLTKSEGKENYVALSYVWGDVPTLKTTIENLSSMQQPGALANAIAKLQIPLTIAHTIHLIQKLDMRYLWVDSICIVQDDNIIKNHQIENMGSIFANASLTIIAAEGQHSNHGISGIRGLSEPRQSTQHIFALPNGIRVCHEPSINVTATKWDTRGWTYQEDFFSSRKLIFGGARVTWKCRNVEFREDFEMDCPTRAKPQGMATLENFISNGWPDLFSYAIACGFFNRRYFTYARDANLAFAGLCSILCAKYDGGFLHGLPEMFFGRCIAVAARGRAQTTIIFRSVYNDIAGELIA
jgi:Heterokaryon incompatibility protein (HET)